MNNDNFLKDILRSYSKCKNWLSNTYPKLQNNLDSQYMQIKTAKFDDEPSATGGGEISLTLQNTIYSDKQNELDKKYKLCKDIVLFSEGILEDIKPQYQNVLHEFTRNNANLEDIAYITNYSIARAYQIISEETERLKNN